MKWNLLEMGNVSFRAFSRLFRGKLNGRKRFHRLITLETYWKLSSGPIMMMLLIICIESGTSNKAEINGSFVKGGEKLSKLLIYGTVVDTSFDMKRMSIRV